METDKIASKYLGKKVDECAYYEPSLLVAIPRSENRSQYNIDSASLPFFGWDIWHAYEFSSMSENAVPITRLLKIKYSCESKFLVESKSLKLYLNSFNMSRFGKTSAECLEICKKIIEKDLSKKLETPVQVQFIDNSAKNFKIFQNFENIMNFVDEKYLKISTFKETPQLLETVNTEEKEYFLTFDSLRSNCRVTHQPDFGDIFIYYKSSKHIIEESLVKYLVSFRSEYHFHEECCEMIYKRLYDLLNKDDKLFVCALYTRRGGIDICPIRANFEFKEALNLLDITKFTRYGVKQ